MRKQFPTSVCCSLTLVGFGKLELTALAVKARRAVLLPMAVALHSMMRLDDAIILRWYACRLSL
jgi:hypothetical protein